MLLGGGTAAVRGQSALDGFDPNANGPVYVVVVQSDGKILVGGLFSTLAPNGGPTVTRNNIARLNHDGTLDTAFNPNANGFVLSIAVQSDGKILAGGQFTTIGGQTRTNMARLDASTGLADSFDPNANNTVRSIAVQADGQILAGGQFTSIGGQTRNHIARLDAVTGLADSWNPNANSTVLAITVQADGKIVAGGFFNGGNSIGGQTRNYIARLDPTTGLADSFNPNANGSVGAIAVQADGKIVAGGFFTGANSIGGQTRNYLARLDATTGLADSFNPNPDSGAGGGVFVITIQPDGKILASGGFGTIGGQSRAYIARLDPTTGLADSLNPQPFGGGFTTVLAIAVQADGKVLLGGDFTMLRPNGGAAVMRNYIARLETDGRLDQTLNISIPIEFNFDRYVGAIAVQPDGKILIGGNFTNILGVARTNIARLNTDGTLDTAFDPNANSDVNAIAVQADGKILVSGSFTSIGGQTRNYIARLDATTGLADSFNPNPNGIVRPIAIQADGKILIGGAFSTVLGVTRTNIARLNTDGTLDTAFNPNTVGGGFSVSTIAIQVDGKILVGGDLPYFGGQARSGIARLDGTTGAADSFNPSPNNLVVAITVQADGKILAGGYFTNIDGQTRNYIARLDGDTGLADAFDPNADYVVDTIMVQADGKILVGGQFGNIGGQPRNYIARLDGASGLADAFDPNADYAVGAIAVQADGKILVGGYFANIGGKTRNLFARLSNTAAALQNLGVTQNALTWTRGGSSPQFTRVTFESSTDNVSYTSLGEGTADGSNWSLTGLSLPTRANLYIRARGYYRSGSYNGSESITESVRNVFLAALATPPPLLNIQLTANTNVVLSWATNFTGFTLESTTNLNTNVWSTVSPDPAVSGTNNVVTNAASGTTRFYRLRK